jgi:TetR/AcrR family transcriptional regulator, cholesterol catabolism regulator
MEEIIEQEPKERIINLAEDKFLQHGFNKVTLDELSGNLGISKKTMYKFFPSKEILVRTMMRMIMKRMEKSVSDIVDSDKPVIEKFAALMLVVGNLAGKISRAFQMDVQRFTPTLWKEVDKFRNEMILTRVARLMSEAKAEGKFRTDVNEMVVIMMFVNSVQAIVNPEVLSQNSFSPKEAMYTIFHVIIEGALTEEARKEFLQYKFSIL